MQNRILKGLGKMQEAVLKPLFYYSLIALFLILFISVIRTSIFPGEEGEGHLIFEMMFLLLLAILARSIVNYFKQPTVLILMLLGIMMGPSFLQMFWPDMAAILPFLPHEAPEIFQHMELVETFAQFGAIILMFKVGLESSIHKIFTKENFIVAILGIFFPFIAGYFFAVYTGGSFLYALFMGAALTATSVGVTAAILKEMNLMDKKFAQMIMGAAIIDDILSLLILSLVMNIPTSMDAAALEPFITVLVYAFIFLLGGSIVGKYFVEKKVNVVKINEKTLLYVLSFVFLYAYIAEFIGLSSIVGAFLAGVLLNYSKHAEEIDRRTRSLELIFIPVFFISLGMLVDVGSVIQFIWPILIISAIAVFTKLTGCGLGAFFSKLNVRNSALVGFGMSPRGEVALIIAVFGLNSGALSIPEYSIISAMAFITTIIIPPIFQRLVPKGGASA
ncbi:MAG: cation:proton antiporter [bacterium]|nr:cation:proton antiporter [bacterium]